MSSSFSNTQLKEIRSILRIPVAEDKETVVRYMNKNFSKLVNNLTDAFQNPKTVIRKPIQLGEVQEGISISYGIKRTEETILLAEWLFDLPKLKKKYILQFLLLKEGLIQLYFSDTVHILSEFNEELVNILTIQLIAEVFNVYAIDNPLMAAIEARIYPEEICGKSSAHWSNLERLLRGKKDSFKEISEMMMPFWYDNSQDTTDKIRINQFTQLVYKKTFWLEKAIEPIFFTERQIAIISNLVNLGYLEGTPTNIGTNLGLHENTIRKELVKFTENRSTYWIPTINLKKLGLKSFFALIHSKNKKSHDKVNRLLDSIPYNQRIYHSRYSNEYVTYCPRVNCPQVIAHNLDAKLMKLEKEKQITSYYLEEAIKKSGRITLIKSKLKFTEKTAQELINGKHDRNLFRFDFQTSYPSQRKTNLNNYPFDYNLLFTLSYLVGRYLLKARLGMRSMEAIHELFKLNDISSTDVDKQTDFINQIEIRSRKRGFLDYDLFIRSITRRSTDILVLEIHNTKNHSEKKISDILNKVKVFSMNAQIDLSDKKILTFPNLNHKHPISQIIKDKLSNNGFKTKSYTIGHVKLGTILYHKLFDFEEQKWKINNF